MNRLRKILPAALFSAILLLLTAMFWIIGGREAPAPAESGSSVPAQPGPSTPAQPGPSPPPQEFSFQTVTEQVPWLRVADLRRVALDAPELPVTVWLEYPVFLPEGEGYEAINAFFQQMSDSYFSPENGALVQEIEAASAGGTPFTRTNTAAVDFTGVLITVTLDREGTQERYLFRADTGEQVDPADADQEEFTGPPWVPPLEYRVTVSENREAGVRRTALDPQGLDLSVYFEVPVFEEDGPGPRAINEFFQALSQDFFSPANETLTQAWMYAAYPWGFEGYLYERPARVHTRTGKLVSVSIGYEWFMGGVADYGSDSYTFRAGTGQRLRLADLAAEGERELKAMILSAARELDGGTGAIDLDRLERYDLDDFEFYVEDGSVFISFDKYEAADGAYGGFTLKIPAGIREEFL